MDESKLVSVSEIQKHNTPNDCWIVIRGQTWDVTRFLQEHPGGSAIIYQYAGRDATEAYSEIHAASVVHESLSPDCFKGTLDQATITEEWGKPTGLHREKDTTTTDTERPSLDSILNSYDFEDAAASFGSKKAYSFYSTAATDCWTRDTNEAMLKRIWFRPRVMKDVARVDTTSTVLNIPVNLPLFICPTGFARLIHPDGEKGLARAAQSTGILEILSTAAGYPMNEILQEAPGYPFLFQLYLNKQREKSRETLQTAERLGIKAIFLTVDAAGRGKRESDERLKTDEVIYNVVTGEPIKADKRGGGLTRAAGSYIDQGMTWRDLAWIRSVTRLPIILKGITGAEDAKLAMQHQVDGIMLSNHGGRNLDYAPPAILLLLELHKNCPEIFDRMEVYVDGGFRRGGDILKALCLGAKAVGIGRSFLYALQYGTEGAEHLVEILKDEMESVMKLIGIKNLSEVHPSLVNTADVDHLVPSGAEHPYAKWSPSKLSKL
ncbi:Cytochrome b5 domain-containing protein 1 [Aspergillus nanangensis]|uniref:L-lactate dehydrogenase (cytochrome) n=1 Tax=Aspergillus nanangensis TaxID=2582783 RepID=A0AAD4CGK2_ASPNN|nr:Cytochrome b5 domain-containing protein 1 [Aspergillus nanangensis]